MKYLATLRHRSSASSVRRGLLQWTAVVAGVVVSMLPMVASAQFSNNAIARTYVISGDTATAGDVVSFDRVTQALRLTRELNDNDLFGVVVNDPIILLRTMVGGVPVVTTGEAYVNVTSISGPIQAGEYVTSSMVSGKAQRATSTTTFILGTALESFPSVASTSAVTSTSTVYTGSIKVLLAIGPHTVPPTPSVSGGGGTTIVEEGTVSVSTPISRLIKYLLASVIVFGTIYLAFKNFTANLKDSVVSIGRNPLAKASIQSITILNTTLIVIVSAVGLFIGLMILFLPL
jgi:hypothetical protein